MAPSSRLTRIENVTVGGPYLLRDRVADDFRSLRASVQKLAGFDFLAVLGDMFRPKSFVKNKPGSVTRSLHKCGVCFDYNQGEKNLVLVRDDHGGRVFWRTYLRITNPAMQKPSQFVARRTLKSERGPVTDWLLDFTALSEAHNWRRIPAQKNWQLPGNSSKREHWHYLHTAADLFGSDPYDRLMAYLYDDGKPPAGLIKPAPAQDAVLSSAALQTSESRPPATESSPSVGTDDEGKREQKPPAQDNPSAAMFSDELIDALGAEPIKSAAGKLGKAAAARKGWRIFRPLVLLYAALEAGNLIAWLGVAVLVIGVGVLVYLHRAGILRIVRKLAGRASEE